MATRQKELAYFQMLHKDRKDNARVLGKPSMQGVMVGVVDKYSDQAHFIYELLQNADDAGATEVRFCLKKEFLVFAHNGQRDFSISNPKTEAEDTKSGRLGDINAIASVGNSSKQNESATIGKFGVGFKAVFQYTRTPRIYTPTWRFAIEQFIVPTLLESDFDGRRSGETLFVFPFDKPDCPPSQAYEEIAEKLRTLVRPLLFLFRLRKITYSYDSQQGYYKKVQDGEFQTSSLSATRYKLSQKIPGGTILSEKLWLFSRQDDEGRHYSVGFFLDEHGKLRPVNEPAFCFFQTKVQTGLNFIVNAPFLLTDSREGIRAGVPHNIQMINNLASLAADSLVALKSIGKKEGKRLIDDRIVDIIPFDPDLFPDETSKNIVSFLPVYQAIKKIFSKEALLPTKSGYTDHNHAYWGANQQLSELFSDQQLAKIVRNPEAHWVFSSIGRDEALSQNRPLATFLDEITRTYINENTILNGRVIYRDSPSWYSSPEVKERLPGIDAAFIEDQSINWLIRFYKWIADAKSRRTLVPQKPIFLSSDKHAVAAFDKKDNPILFLPTEGIAGYITVNPALIKDKETLRFLKEMGVSTPSLRDYIYNIILPKYKNNSKGIDTIPDFQSFFRYFRECPHDNVEDFLNLIRECEFLRFKSISEPDTVYRGRAATLYFPDEDLKAYFSAKPDTRFLCWEDYQAQVDADDHARLKEFLLRLGVRENPRIIIQTSWPQPEPARLPDSTRSHHWENETIDGLEPFLTSMAQTPTPSESELLWRIMLRIVRQKKKYDTFSLRLTCHYFYYTDQKSYYEASDGRRLRETPWLMSHDGTFHSANELHLEDLAECYDTKSTDAQAFLRFLNVTKRPQGEPPKVEPPKLSPEESKDLEVGRFARENGITQEDLERLARRKKERHNSGGATNGASDAPDEKPNVIRDILAHVAGTATSTPSSSQKPEKKQSQEKLTDQDEFVPKTIDYKKQIFLAQEKSATEIGHLIRLQNLQDQLAKTTKYSCLWYRTLLELELDAQTEICNGKDEIALSFAKVSRDSETKRTLILECPNRAIPPRIEELSDIRVTLYVDCCREALNVIAENVSIKDGTLRVKLADGASLRGIDPASFSRATITVQNPLFLLKALRDAFAQLPLSDDFDLRENLTHAIRFVFGPPGTGKTTTLVREYLIPEMKSEQRILVLAPTNKAADVLTRRLMEHASEEYKDWLIRFGGTDDIGLEDSEIFHARAFKLEKRIIVVTTIARYPYDMFNDCGITRTLHGVNWDVVVVDEASMIPLYAILYLLYSAPHSRFVIAGDPFQIEPIASVAQWKGENIYTFVGLNSFTSPVTVPHKYPIHCLTTQYRSLPAIGKLFSDFAYGGVLTHARTPTDRRPINLGDRFQWLKPLNVVTFPVSSYESIYRARRLNGASNYHVYSALLSFELLRALAHDIATYNPHLNQDHPYRIGLISPYRVQAEIVRNLAIHTGLITTCRSQDVREKTYQSHFSPGINVQVGTVHKFQGDECDILVALFNPPPYISDSNEMFLNKLNIVNVSISRARDNLLLLIPDANTENVGKLIHINTIKKLVHASGSTSFRTAEELERLLFNEEGDFLELHTFVTGHQSVNVYERPEHRYEVRAEDNAIDIQLVPTLPST